MPDDASNPGQDVPAPDESTLTARPGSPQLQLTARPGDRFGNYKILEEIGQGGCGVVFVAEQEKPVRRRVALKVVKLGMDTRQVIGRFEAERQALAMMDHPNIAKVLDAGATDTGRPFFVMELVKGIKITDYCDHHNLSTTDRLQLFMQVCSAVQHAHQKGIIHRDLKPSNILVTLHDGVPIPKVIDFGIAKATADQKLTDKTVYTALEQFLGTPAYMSPEQAEMTGLDVDTRSDIYSLGVLLYELLTGETPFDSEELLAQGIDAMRRTLREKDPERPSNCLSTMMGADLAAIALHRQSDAPKLVKLVRGDLDWIVMKCLEKDRTRRYETANGLAMDIQRHLSCEPVVACPPSAGYRFRKFARRHKGGVAVAALVLLFLVVVGSGVGWVVRDRTDRQSRIEAQVDLILDEVDRLEREQNWPEALAAARQAEAAATGGEADAATEQRVRQRLRDIEFLDRLEHIRMQAATFVDGKFDYAGTDREYAQAFRDYGVDVQALAVETSIDRLKARPELAIPLAAALDDWMVQRRVSVEDTSDWKRLVAVARGIDPDRLRDRLRSTWGRPRSDQETRDELHQLAESIDVRAQRPATLVRLSDNLLQVNDLDSAMRVLRDAQSVYPGDFWLNFKLGRALAVEKKDYEGSVRFHTAAVSIRPNSSAAHNNLGAALSQQQKLEEAVTCFENAIELDPKNTMAYHGRAGTYGALGQWAKAAADFQHIQEVDPENADAWRLAAYAFLAAGDAASYRRTCRELVERFGQTDDPVIAERTAKVCSLAPGAVADFGVVERLAQVAVTGTEQDGNYHYFVLAKGLTENRAGRHAEAVQWLERFAPDAARGWDIDAIAFAALAMAQHRLGRTDEAKEALATAKAIIARNIPDRSERQRFRGGNWHDWLHAEILIREAEDLIGVISAQELLSLRLERWNRELDQLPHEELWYSPRRQLCREIATDAELFGAVQQLRPDDADLSIARGQVLAQAEKWDEAAEWFGRVIDQRGLSEDACQAACLHLLTDRPDAYRQFCTKLIGQAGDVSDPHVDFVLARTCILIPEMAASPEQVVTWAEQAVSDERSPWSLHVLGAACCRAGDYSQAIELLEESNASNWTAEGKALNALVLVIAHQRQGDSASASECLNRARALMAGVDHPAPPDWLEYHVLVREAEKLIEARP